MEREKLRKLSDLLKNFEQVAKPKGVVGFDICMWKYDITETNLRSSDVQWVDKPKCGTVCCAAGLAAEYFDELVYDDVIRTMVHKNWYGYYALEQFFDINSWCAEMIFSSDTYYDHKATPLDVAKRIDQLLYTGTITTD